MVPSRVRIPLAAGAVAATLIATGSARGVAPFSALAASGGEATQAPPAQVKSNEPAGFTPLYRIDFASGQEPGRGQSTRWSYNANGELVPRIEGMPGAAFVTTLPAGLGAGDQPVITRFWSRAPDGPHTGKPTYRRVYQRFALLLPGADIMPGGVGTKLFYWGYGRLSNDNDGWIALAGNGIAGDLSTHRSVPLKVYLSHGDAGKEGSDLKPALGYDQNMNLAAGKVTAGRRHVIESLLDLGSLDQPNGRVQVWVDGVLTHDIRNLSLRHTADDRTGTPEKSTYGVFNMSWVPVWGSSKTRPRTDRLVLGDIYLSAADPVE